ncbi:MAG: DUF3095 family protein [Candidatus Dojkabacteria bacterium]|nr:DUF3095 family protein [Candidatus Dojkabacteria bacterium]
MMETMSDTSSFYKNLPYVNDFLEIGEKNSFREASSDWFILIADIENSTVLLCEGRPYIKR